MATSSITHNFVISNPNSVKPFIAAIDEADRDRTPKQTEITTIFSDSTISCSNFRYNLQNQILHLLFV